MLISRNLDDQNYTDIVEHAVKRIPQLCPGWTNYNASDPGITLVELLAWYKEMEQYHMNYYTDEMELQLLKLLGITPQPESPAQCLIELPDDGVTYPAGSRFYTPEGTAFELSETAEADRASVAGIYSVKDGRWTDITPAFTGGSSAVPVFSFGGETGTDIAVAFTKKGGDSLSIWIEVEDPGEPVRNPFAEGQKMPRELVWEFSGSGRAEPCEDGTKALSQSGFVRFKVPKSWGRVMTPDGKSTFYVLKLSLRDAGCEEEVMLRKITAGRYKAVQQETRSVLRDEPSDQELRTKATLDLETEDASGKRKKMVCVMDPDHVEDLIYSSDGLPDQAIRIETDDKKLLPDRLTVVCSRKDTKGHFVHELWHYAEDLRFCGPKDRAFSYDRETHEICFGDGMNGRIPQAGEGNILLAGLVLSEAGEGNIPSGSRLKWADGDGTVYNTQAFGGRDRETPAEASGRLMRRINEPQICVSADDYERLAKATPGRRVLAAHAVPGYDPDEPSGMNRIPVVTVIAVPAGEGYRPEPDEEFLSCVEKHLEAHRIIGTVLRVRGPKYCPVEIRADLDTSARIDESEILRAFTEGIRLSSDPDSVKIGETLQISRIYGILQNIPGVVSVAQASIKSLNSGCALTPIGDLTLPPDGVPYVSRVRITQY